MVLNGKLSLFIRYLFSLDDEAKHFTGQFLSFTYSHDIHTVHILYVQHFLYHTSLTAVRGHLRFSVWPGIGPTTLWFVDNLLYLLARAALNARRCVVRRQNVLSCLCNLCQSSIVVRHFTLQWKRGPAGGLEEGNQKIWQLSSSMRLHLEVDEHFPPLLTLFLDSTPSWGKYSTAA